MKKLLILTILLTSSTLFAQYHKAYNWDENPILHNLNTEESQESSVGILKRKIVEFHQPKNAKNIAVFETTHTIIRVNDDTGIQRHNQVYISMRNGATLTDIKARTITKNNSVTNLDQNNIKEVENVEEYGDFKIFAIEGAEVGSDIEVLYTVEKRYSPFGSETLQNNYPIKRSEMVFITNNLKGTIKTYNTDQEFERTYIGSQLVEELVLSNVSAIVEEEYSATAANKIYAAYQCFGNPEITQEILWSNTIENVAKDLFPAQIQKVVIDEVRKNIMKKNDELSQYEKAARLDNYIKSNFTVVENNNSQLEEIDYILKNRSSSDFGILKVYTNFLAALDVDYEIVLTANRYMHRLDPDFYNPNALREFLIYLPETKQYISPTRIDYRLSEAPRNILGNQGIYINKSYEFRFEKITQNDPDYSRIKRIMNINFSKDFDKVTVDEDQEYYGHWGVQNRAYMALTSGESKSKFEDYLTGSGIEDKNVTKFYLENTDMNQTEYNLPYIVKSTMESSSLIEDAGGSYIFQVGKIIGIQSELYQEKERVSPIEMQYPNKYNYTITINIPKGYTLDGLESLEIDKKLELEGTLLCKFNSSYEIKKNKLIISIEEVYKVNEYSVEDYEAFREVINAASDFNKAAILFSEE